MKTNFFAGLVMIGLASFSLAGCASKSESGTKPDYTGRTYAGISYGVLNSDEGESWISYNGDVNRMIFGRHNEDWSRHTLYESDRSTGGWSEPAVLPFSGTYNDRGARFYPALDAVLFSSDRPLVDGGEAGDFNLWLAMHDGEEWLAPEPMTALNSPSNDFHASVDGEGNIYFASDRKGGKGGSDIYRAHLGKDGYVVEPLKGLVNTEYSESDVYVEEMASFMIFSRTEHPDGFGEDDLWISFPTPDGWTEAVNLGPEVNSPKGEYGATLDETMARLMFTTHRDGKADIVAVPLAELKVEWPTN